MLCRNCGFETNNPNLTRCPECSGILSSERSSGSSPEKEEIFQDIENILNNDELSELYERASEKENSERENYFDLDFEAANQSDGNTLEAQAEDNDETGDEIEPENISKFTFVLFFIFSLTIAAGAGVLYLKAKQPASPAFPQENISIYKNEKTFTIKNKAFPRAIKEPEAEKIPETPEQQVMEKSSLPEKQTAAANSPAEPQKNKADETIAKNDNSWTSYVPGKQTYYTLQISSLSNRSFARANLNRLKSKQYPAYVLLTRNQEGKEIFKLRIGKYETAEKAKKAAEVFYKKEKMKYIILKSNADINL